MEKRDTKRPQSQSVARSEEELRRAAHMWQVTFDGVKDAIFVLDAGQCVQQCNKAAVSLFGMSKKKMLGRHCWEIVHGGQKATPECPFRRMVGSRKRETMELAIGDRRYQVVVDPLLDRNGQVQGGVHIVSDITERKQAEAALARERDLLQSVMNSAGKAHLVYLDHDFNFVRVNATYAATCGYRPEKMIGKNHFALYPNAENEAIFRRVRDTGKPFEVRDKPFEFPGQPERGVTYWDWTLIPVKNADGQVIGLIFSLFETTARKQAEAALQQLNATLERRVTDRTAELQGSETRFRTIFDAAGDGMFLSGLKTGRIRLANKACLDMLGYTQKEFMTLSLEDLHHKDDLPFIRAEIAKFHRGKVAPRAEIRFRRKDGSFLDTELHPTAMRLNGQDYLLVAIRDIGERKRLQAEVERVAEMERQHLGRDLHDGLSQHLAALSLHASVLQRRLKMKRLPESGAAGQLVALTRTAVEITRDLARGLYPVSLQLSGLGTALHELAKHVQDMFPIRCRFCNDDSLRLANADLERQLFRIAQEAAYNAAKHSRGRHIWIRLYQTKHWVMLTIKDDGAGVPAARLAAHDMGLNIMRYRAGLIGAELKFESARGRGTTVTCQLRRQMQ